MNPERFRVTGCRFLNLIFFKYEQGFVTLPKPFLNLSDLQLTVLH